MNHVVIAPEHLSRFAEPGDIIAFQGKGLISSAIRLWTWSAISHVGIMYDRHTLIESTQMEGQSGVVSSLAKHRIEGYDGRVALLKIKQRSRLDTRAMRDFLLRQDGKPYDYKQVARLTTPFFWQRESHRRFFCSELAASAHIAGGLYVCNSSETTPADLCRFRIYEPRYYQVKDYLDIPRYNTVVPDGWRIRI